MRGGGGKKDRQLDNQQKHKQTDKQPKRERVSEIEREKIIIREGEQKNIQSISPISLNIKPPSHDLFIQQFSQSLIMETATKKRLN